MIFGSILKKRIKEEQIANIFTNSLIKTVDEGFSDVASLINEAPEFVSKPLIGPKDSGNFLLIIIAGNLKLMSKHFPSHQEKRLLSIIMENFAKVFQVRKHDFNSLMVEYQTFIGKVNHPSTNILYGMSKAVFYKFNLSIYQEEYFKNLNSPNPLFLKRLDEIMVSFVWDWDHLKDNYNLVFK